MEALANEWGDLPLAEWGIDIPKDWLSDYSKNIEAPIYTPNDEKPEIGELFDETKTAQLLKNIDLSVLPEDEKNFLRIAANRHTVLNYKKIADYYAHSGKEIQQLMEESALIIIDFKKAIELGYVRLSEEIIDQFRVEHGD